MIYKVFVVFFFHKATSEHSDLVSRRIGFIPLPLGCILCKTVSQSVSFPHIYWIKFLASAYIRYFNAIIVYLHGVGKLLFFSLLFVKTVLGVLLLRTAWRYHDQMKESEKEEHESTAKLPVSLGTHALHKKHADSSIGSHSSRDSESLHRKSKSRSLSEIERFTLCSNRII